MNIRNLETPIIQAPIEATPNLTAAVSNTGAMGSLEKDAKSKVHTLCQEASVDELIFVRLSRLGYLRRLIRF